MPVSSSPQVAVLVLNFNGREHLERCLPTLVAQDYPGDRFRIEVIDNGSTDGSAELVRSRFPGVTLHRFESNRGFAAAYDDIARQTASEFLAFLNNDTRVEPNWLTELVSAADRHCADCVGARILDWDGKRIDFVGGLLTFIGHSWQRDAGAPADRDYHEGRQLFACAGSMLISRRAYVEAGGFDRDFFAYFEDVDLGWRLAVLGYTTVFAPRAVTYHRLHGTAARMSFASRLRLYERNALSMIFKNYEAATLDRVLPAAVALSLLRGLLHSGIDPQLFRLGSSPPPTTSMTPRLAAHLLAIEDFGRQLPALAEKRAAIQSRRQVPDRDVFPLFREPFRLHEEGVYADVARTLIRDLELERWFDAGGGGTPVSGARRAGVSQEQRTSGGGEAGLPQTDPSPLVSIVVLTVLGPQHLPDCLPSLYAQSYPADRREVIVVDNASPEDPTQAVAQHYPGARVIRNATNVGFSVGNNIGARAARGEYVVFLNDDTRVDAEWLRELVDTAIRRRAASVASRMLTWDGTRIDFVGGTVNCEARGFQTDIGQFEAGRHTEECPLLFACGGAMLVKRDVFLDAGGWDEGAFAYYEDVELGWRLWLLGHEVWFSPRSLVYHKHHGTWGRWPEPPRLRLYERNSLRILYTHLEPATLQRVLPAALLLAADRALLATDLSRAARDPEEIGRDRHRALVRQPPAYRRVLSNLKGALRQRGVVKRQSIAANLRQVGVRGIVGALRQAARASIAPPSPSRRAAYQIERAPAPALDEQREPIPTSAAAALTGLHDFLVGLPALSEKRHWLQGERRRSDREILSRFNRHWSSPAVAPHQAVYEELHRTLVELFHIDELAAGAEPDGRITR